MAVPRLAPFRRTRRALSRARLRALQKAVLESPFIGLSTLAGSFQASRGFGVTFTGAGVPEVLGRFPFLTDWWEQVRARRPERALQAFPQRLWQPPLPAPNAFFLNLLVLPEGADVGRHVDATLARPSGVLEATPLLVSVLYLAVPRGAQGGRLFLDDGTRLRGVVTPREGALVHFDGRLAHRVEAFEGGQGQPDVRASLVLEQYHFGQEALARLPACRIHSRAGFSAFLADHRRRGEPVGHREPDEAP